MKGKCQIPGCTYSKTMAQPYPLICIVCGHPESELVGLSGIIEQCTPPGNIPKKPYLLSFRINIDLMPWAGNNQWSQMLVYAIDSTSAEKALKQELHKHYTHVVDSAIEIVNSTIE